MIQVKGSNSKSNEGSEATARAKPPTKIADERTNVGTPSATHLEINGRKVVRMYVKTIDAHGAGLEVERLIAAGAFVGRDAVHFHGTDVGRNLVDDTLKRVQRQTKLLMRGHACDGDRYERSIRVETLAGDIKAGCGAIDFGLVHDALDKLGGATQAQDEDAGSARIERSGVPAFPLAGDRAGLVKCLRRGDSNRLMEVDKTVHIRIISQSD